jgi:histidinol phosphatase-like enzyme (inositol monophosphatase family)
MTAAGTPDDVALVAFAHELAGHAAGAILPYFRQTLAIEDKNDAVAGAMFDPVTAADRAAEQAIRAAIAARYPEHSIEGEEYGVSGSGSPYNWIIDPIDGTRSFMMGMLTWGVLIGLSYRGIPRIGLMSQPFTGETFWSTATEARYRGPHGLDHQIKTRSCGHLKDAVLACTHPSLFQSDDELARYKSVAKQVKLSRYGGDCYGFAMLAAGHIDLMIESGLKSFDVAALIPIIERAGGRLTTWDGGSALAGGQILASGDPKLHDQVLRLLNA